MKTQTRNTRKKKHARWPWVVMAVVMVMVIVAAYAIIWNKAHKIPVNEVVPLEVYVNRVRERSEYLPVWDEAVVEWMDRRAAGKS